ncbi:MAG: ABC transporter permease [Acidimicrobiales bacterium]
MTPRVRRLLWGAPVPIVLLGLWYLAVQNQWVDLIPQIGEVGREMWDFTFGGIHDNPFSASLLTHLRASGGRVLTGFAWATALAVPLGIGMGRSPRLAAMVDPTLSLLRPVPVTAWVPLVLIVFGIGSKSAVILIFIAAFYPILLNTIAGVKAVPKRLVEAAAMLGTKGRAMLYKVVLPAALPAVLGGMRIALGFAWVVVVVGETVGVQTGLGSVITEAREISNTELIITGMVFIGLAGFATDRAMTGIIRLALRHRPLV